MALGKRESKDVQCLFKMRVMPSFDHFSPSAGRWVAWGVSLRAYTLYVVGSFVGRNVI
jgi:hypothetical protein